MKRQFSCFTGLLALVPTAVLMAAPIMPATTPPQPAGDRPFLASLFTDNMVLQRERRDPVWGWTAPGAPVTVTLTADNSPSGPAENVQTDAGPDGRWSVEIGPMRAGGPYTLSVKGPQNATLHNVLFGDVWIASGQSNMEFGIGNAINAAQEIASADHPDIRLFTVPKAVAFAPQATIADPGSQPAGKWLVSSPQTVREGGWGGFSAVAYFFGRKLEQELHVPIGLIHTSWGGTIAEAWTSERALGTLPDFQAALTAEQHLQASKEIPSARKGNPNQVTVLYNGMIAPLIPFGIKGVIWYQGESNAGRAQQYEALLPTLIQDWRTRWGQGNFPFLIVQLANFMARKEQPTESEWAELRNAQLLTFERVPRTGLAVIMDIGDATDIHPKDKQDVGDRLARAALQVAYGRHIEGSGPIYRSMRREGSQIRIRFSHIDGGLVAHDGPLVGFAVAGADHKFVWANATISGADVVVWSPQVARPLAVRYAWADNPAANLYNRVGLAASPFRTDKWREVTAGRK